MKKGLLTMLGIGFFLWFTTPCIAGDLRILAGAGLIKPMEELRQNFEKQHAVKIDAHYGSSGEIFGMVAAGQPCSILVPGAEKYSKDALKNGWILGDTMKKMILHIPVIAVPKGNPANIRGLADLTHKGVRVAIGDPRAPAIGRVARDILKKAGFWDQTTPNIKVYAPTVNQLLIYVSLKQVDAAIIWMDLISWAEAKGKLEVIAIEKRWNMTKTIPTAVCTSASDQSLARELNQYISSEEGMDIWEKWGFEPCGR